MLNYRLFQANEYPLEMYNGEPLIELGFAFFYDDCGTDVEFDFPGFVSGFMYVFNERNGRLLKTYTPTQNGNTLILNEQDTDFEDNGKYYYQVGYMETGGYEHVLRFGTLTVI